MKYSYNWLKELTKTKKSPGELAEMVMLKGFELEGIEDLADKYKNFVVGKILEIQKHPGADKLQLVKVDVGKGKLEVVCGAWNIQVGDVVPVALVGAIVPLSKMRVEKREVRGKISNGMLCAEDELGLGKDHSGIMILDKSLKPGTDLAKTLGLEDQVLEFDVLPNRAHDCLSYEGMGREICAMLNSKFKIQNSKLQFKSQMSSESINLDIDIMDKELCPRYIGAVLTGVKIGPSPKWMQARLAASGMEPINNVVDITNYVMLEVGNPLHAFDLEKIKNQESKVEIIVRRANKNEKLELLDGTGLILDENDLVIANKEKTLALAGIKGGKDSGISKETTEIVLESANFQALNIRKSRQRHSLLTESQQRFEKGISPVLAQRAAFRAIELLQKYAGATLVEMNDADFSRQKPQLLKLETDYANRLLGYEVAQKQIIKILENLGFVLKDRSEKSLVFEVPFWRLDVEGQEDLIEEVGRIIGYEKIEEKPIKNNIELPKKNQIRDFEWKIKDILVGLGFDEVVNYSFYSGSDTRCLPLPGGVKHFELENPLSEDQILLRRSLLPNLLKNVAENSKYFEMFSIFELGRVYLAENYDGRPEEMKISGAVIDQGAKDEQLFNLAKSKIEGLFGMLGLPAGIYFQSPKNKPGKIFHPTRTAEIFYGSESFGFLGQLDKEVGKMYSIKNNVMVFELDFQKIMLAFDSRKPEYKPANRFPAVERDISMFVDYKVQAGEVENVIVKVAGKQLQRLELFDVFVDKEKSRKSLAFHMSFGDENKTLEGKEADEIFYRVSKELQKKLKVEVRTR